MVNPADICEALAEKLPPNMQLSDHFSVLELSCRHCQRVYIVPVLLEMLEQLRKMIGVPLVICSGYRCPTHNRRIGGSTQSRHCLGMAADIAVPDKYRMNPAEFLEAAEAVTKKVNGGFHYYPASHFIHIDCWPYPANRRW